MLAKCVCVRADKTQVTKPAEKSETEMTYIHIEVLLDNVDNQIKGGIIEIADALQDHLHLDSTDHFGFWLTLISLWRLVSKKVKERERFYFYL